VAKVERSVGTDLPLGEPVELRIHGVGGSTPEDLLGVDDPSHARRVAGGAVSGFWRRRPAPERAGHAVEGYVWGGLTSQSTFQPLWLLLMPFTLLNVAGWMHRSARGTWKESWLRHLVGLCGFALTGVWTLWTATLVIEHLFWYGIGGRWAPGLRVGVGVLVCVVLLAGVAIVARFSTRDFERIYPPEGRTRDDVEDYTLEHPLFWAQRAGSMFPQREGTAASSWTDRHIAYHGVLAGAVLVGVTVRAVTAIDGGGDAVALGIGQLLVPAAAVVLVLLVALATVSAMDTLWPDRLGAEPPAVHPRRIVGPATASAMAFGITFTGLGGVARILPGPDTDAGAAPAAQVLADVAGFTTAVTALCVVVLVVVHLRAKRPDDVVLHPVTLPPASRLVGVPHRGWQRKVGVRRRLAKVLGRLGWVLAPPAAIFVAYATFKLWPGAGRIGSWPDVVTGVVQPTACAGGVAEASLRWLVSGCGGPGVEPRWLADAGGWLVGAAATLGPAALWGAARNPHTRAAVGILWDVLTFWPRWHHPFAVRCYAERAVPEIQQRLVRLGEAGHPVVISAHSQGTVLAIAALASLEEDLTHDIDVVTFGSPLTTLYARFFPAYFGRGGDYADVCTRVESWQNFYRLTDYVGQKVNGVAVDDELRLDDPRDEAEVDPETLWRDERPAPAWTTIWGHSGYRTAPEVQGAVRAAAKRATMRWAGEADLVDDTFRRLDELDGDERDATKARATLLAAIAALDRRGASTARRELIERLREHPACPGLIRDERVAAAVRPDRAGLLADQLVGQREDPGAARR
jgi:hypothetical protein